MRNKKLIWLSYSMYQMYQMYFGWVYGGVIGKKVRGLVVLTVLVVLAKFFLLLEARF